MTECPSYAITSTLANLAQVSIDTTYTEKTWQENGLTFSVLWNPF
jgi:hypothetical protein